MDFIKRVASYSPVPAGGAAVANSFCLAIALIYKVVLFEAERNYHNPVMNRDLLDIRKEIERLLRDAERLVDEDSETYIKFAESQRTGDKARMQQHFNEIIEVSMKIMEKSDAGFRWIQQLHEIIPQKMATHLLIAGELLMGAINGTAHIVKANLGVLNSAAKSDDHSKRLHQLYMDYKNRHQTIVAELNQFSEAQ